jgi:hypothetical protein
MDRALFGDEPLMILKIICCFFIYNVEVYCLQRGISERFPLCLSLGNSPVKVLKIVGNPLENLSQGARGHWQLSGKFVIGCQRFSNSTYLSEGCQYPLIFCQRVLITFQSSWQRVLETSRDICTRVAPLTNKGATILQYLQRI